MSTRREFLKAAWPIAGMSALACVLPTPRDAYEPVGYLDTESPGADDVDFVTLNGERVEYAFRLNDVEGWVEHYGSGIERPYHRTGVVRVHWRAAR